MTGGHENRDEGARERLGACLARLREGPWAFVQLRGEPLGEADIDRGDVDLLGTRESVDRLLEAAFGWVLAGDCHLRVERRRGEKVELSIFSVDGKHRLLLDLWIELWQVNRRRQRLRFEDIAAHVAGDRGLLRMPADVEACVYLHHLACKRRDLADAGVRERLAGCAQRCREAGEDGLAARLEAIRESKTLRDEDEGEALALLVRRLGISEVAGPGRRRGGLGRLWREAVLFPPRRTSLVALMGCDGSGKTTLAHRLRDDLPEVNRVFTGKHLYRKSIIYKLAVIFLRPLTFQSREKFDEILAPLVYLRASLGLEIRRWRTGDGLTLIDRSITDFLYVDRKTDAPRFARGSWLARVAGRRIPTVHCILPYAAIVKRKDEMTGPGHAAYDRDMFRHFARRAPTSYVLFSNDRSLEAAAAAMARVVQRIRARDD